MIYYCSLVLSSTTFYTIKTEKGLVTCVPQDAIDVFNTDVLIGGLRYYDGLVRSEVDGDVIYGVIVSRITPQIIENIKNACKYAKLSLVGVMEESGAVLRYLEEVGSIIGGSTVTVVGVGEVGEVKTLLGGEEIGKRNGIVLPSLDLMFIQHMELKYPYTREILETTMGRTELLIAFGHLKTAFENGTQWVTGAFRIVPPSSMKHLFQSHIEIKMQEIREIYEPFIQGILQLLTNHISNGYTNDKRFNLQPLNLLYMGIPSAYMMFRLDIFAKRNNMGLIMWPCDIGKMIMIGGIMSIDGLASSRDSGDSSNSFKVPKLEEFFKSGKQNVPRNDFDSVQRLASLPVTPNYWNERTQAYGNHSIQSFGIERTRSNGYDPINRYGNEPKQYYEHESSQKEPILNGNEPLLISKPLPIAPVGEPTELELLNRHASMPATPTKHLNPLPDQQVPPKPSLPPRNISNPPQSGNLELVSQPVRTNPDMTLLFVTECESDRPSIPSLSNLYSKGADPSPSVHIAITCLNHQLFHFLMSLNVNLEWKDEEGNTALLVAASCGSVEMVRVLLARSDVSVRNNSGSNVVICATQNECRFEVLEMVVKAGGDVGVLNMYGTGVQRAISELDVSGEEKEALLKIVDRVDEQIMNINF